MKVPSNHRVNRTASRVCQFASACGLRQPVTRNVTASAVSFTPYVFQDAHQSTDFRISELTCQPGPGILRAMDRRTAGAAKMEPSAGCQ